ncbi:MAG: hypothetical protein M1818_008419 [Claussenomyces sp. TS43310]|nr:MAG: hypothetical protein M1818_008419 [Claussenomyces sp. TS43310]
MADRQSPPTKLSRYRSVRQAAAVRAASSAEPVPQKDVQDGTIHRSMSRYRARHAPSNKTHTTLEVPPVSRIARHSSSPNLRQSRNSNHSFDAGDCEQPTSLPIYDEDDQIDQKRRQALNDLEARERSRVREAEAAYRRDQETLRQQGLRGQQDEVREQREVEEANEILAEQKRKDLARLENELAAATVKPAKIGKPSTMKERFALFPNSKWKESIPVPHSAKPSSEPFVIAKVNPNSSSDDCSKTDVLPGADTPISAVNAGERRVLVRFKQSSINLPITAETTPVSLMYAAIKLVSGTIDPSSTIVLESYNTLGLERRIRRYEYVREVMNSWDRDTQNALVLQPSDSPSHDHDLRASAAPTEAPTGLEVCMYHSQRPGKWNKRYITLITTGQIFISKRPKMKFSDKGITNICHLSDFDIYTLTPQQMRKNLKPPKKHCYAIKSQQKTNMFLNTQNYVHFFSTDDIKMADEWYDAVQQWRSWYLLKKVGVNKNVVPLTLITKAGRFEQDDDTKASEKDGLRVNSSLKPPHAGLSRHESSSPVSPTSSEEDENRPRQIPFHLRNSALLSRSSPPPHRAHPPPVSLTRPNLFANGSSSLESIPANDRQTFAATGLLGRTYTQRKQHTAHKEPENRDSDDGPFIPGPSLLNNNLATDQLPNRPQARGDSARRMSLSAKHPAPSADRSKIQRAVSKRALRIPAPLIDLTPKFVEPPQWRLEGKGRGVVVPEGVPLVEVANTPDLAIDSPKPTAYRRDETRT